MSLPHPTVCFLTFHGGIGEGGSFQGLLDILDIPYTGPTIQGAVYGMNKVVMKYILEKNGYSLLPWIMITKEEWSHDNKKVIKRMKTFCPYPLIVKPTSLGSSIGVTKVENDEDLEDAIGVDFLYDSEVIIEKFGEHMKEVNCSVMRIHNTYTPSPLEEVKTTNSDEDIFSYSEKYLQGGKKKTEGMAEAKRNIPASISPIVTKSIQDAAVQICKTLHMESLVRIDFLVDTSKNIFYPLEINSIPGSLSFYLWEAAGTQFHEVITMLIQEAIYRHNEEAKMITSFDSPLWNSE